MNSLHFYEIVKGSYGRKVAYTDFEEVNEGNILKIVADCIGTFNLNKKAIKYLWDYKNGEQPVRYRQKTIRDDVRNVVVENHAWEIVAFKVAQTYGEAIQFVSLKDDEQINIAVDRLNDYMRAARKQVHDINCGEWQSAVGMGYKAVVRNKKALSNADAIPFYLTAPTPLNTFIIYSRPTGQPLLAVQELKDEEGNYYKHCFSDTHEFKIQNGKLLGLDINVDGTIVASRLHAFGGIPIVEYPNNQDRLSDVELVIDLLDAINNMQSNRMDSIEQFVQSWVKFINCDIDSETFAKMKLEGALVVKSNNGADHKADVDIMTQELNQEQTQVAKDDLWSSALSISAIPNRGNGGGGGDRAGATYLRDGWDFSKQRAKLKDPYVAQAEMQLAEVVINVIRIAKGKDELPLSIMDFDAQINHSPTDNMQVKAETFGMLIEKGIHPLVAIKVCGLWGDPEKVYLLSKPYLDVLYKTIDDVVEDAEAQEKKAQELIAQTGE